ncbi:pyridoxamine 5'-phosphate oxidase family protein [Flavobacteriaceae bacterium F08102]|nr:pyridoxamine 5'-phosphate oxidase family protein [Flavobacteriaceae bacterium F08102]
MIKNLSEAEKQYILSNHYIGYLGYIYQDRPFVVPITFFYHQKENVIIGYSNNGHKLHAMQLHNKVSLQIAQINAINQWKSIMVHGRFEQQNGTEATSYLHEFSLGIKNLILEHEFRKVNFISEFSSKALENQIAQVFLIRIDEITGKMRRA